MELQSLYRSGKGWGLFLVAITVGWRQRGTSTYSNNPTSYISTMKVYSACYIMIIPNTCSVDSLYLKFMY